MSGKPNPDRKIKDARRIVQRYELGGCYTVDDWNVYAKACHVLGEVPRLNPQDPSTNVATLRSQGWDI